MSEYKKQFEEATEKIKECLQMRVEAAKGMLVEFLAEKGVEVGKPCMINYGKGTQTRNIVGIFEIVATEDNARLKFYPYKSNGVLSKNSKAFMLGVVPNMSWTAATPSSKSVNSVVPSEAPPLIDETTMLGEEK